MSILKKQVDYKYLEEELHQALREDELYQLQNDAKIRAVEQRVPTYNHFREMVNGAHLKPLEKNDLKNRIPIPLNSFANRPEDWSLDSTIIKNTESETLLSKTEEDIQKSIPKNTKEFMSRWKIIVDPNSKFEYLVNMREDLGRIFLIEVPHEFFEDVIDLCLGQLSNGKIKDIIDVFSIFSRCNRFQLTLIFLTNEKKIILKQLLQELFSSGITECKELKDKYEIILK